MKRKYLFRIILAVIALAVWGNNLVQIFTEIKEEDKDSSIQSFSAKQDTSSQSTLLNSDFTYTGKYRDPFQQAFTNPEDSKVKASIPKKKELPKPVIPTLRYTGLIKDQQGRMAVIEKPNGEVVFAMESDEVDGVKIQKILGDSLQCRFGREQFWIRLNP
jgi:Tfp pilus assembly protein PilP